MKILFKIMKILFKIMKIFYNIIRFQIREIKVMEPYQILFMIQNYLNKQEFILVKKKLTEYKNLS
jgi:hypothetical protein